MWEGIKEKNKNKKAAVGDRAVCRRGRQRGHRREVSPRSPRGTCRGLSPSGLPLTAAARRTPTAPHRAGWAGLGSPRGWRRGAAGAAAAAYGGRSRRQRLGPRGGQVRGAGASGSGAWWGWGSGGGAAAASFGRGGRARRPRAPPRSPAVFGEVSGEIAVLAMENAPRASGEHPSLGPALQQGAAELHGRAGRCPALGTGPRPAAGRGCRVGLDRAGLGGGCGAGAGVPPRYLPAPCGGRLRAPPRRVRGGGRPAVRCGDCGSRRPRLPGARLQTSCRADILSG